jgi:hypothetical protein
MAGMTQLVQRFVDDAFRAETAQALPSPEMLRQGRGLPAGTIPVRANSLLIDGDQVPLNIDPGSEHANETRHGQWSVEFFDDSDSGNDKAAAVTAWKPTGTKLIFIGDGVSDLPIATSGGGADVIFAKAGRALERVCKEKGLAHRSFESFAEVHDQVMALLDRWAREENMAPAKL